MDIEESARFVLPVLNGETLPGKAYRGLSRHDLKFKAKKRDVKEGAIEDGDVHKSFTITRESGSAVWKLDEERLERLNAMGLLPCKAADERTLEIIFRPSVIETLVGNRKTKRTKEATLRYILELKNGVSISEASKAANITRPTEYQILRDIADLNRL